MATYRNWSVSLWWDPDDVRHCRILSRQNWMAAYLGYTLRMKTLFHGWPVKSNLSPDETEWRLISATLCWWRRCFVADQLWFMTRIREEEEDGSWHTYEKTAGSRPLGTEMSTAPLCYRLRLWSSLRAIGDFTYLWSDKAVFPSLVRNCGTRCRSLFVTHLWQWRSSAHIWRLFAEHVVLSIAPSWQFRL